MTVLLVWLCLLTSDGGTSWRWPQDSGSPPGPRPTLKPEDQEVVKNLDLLEHLDETSDLELLQELSAER